MKRKMILILTLALCILALSGCGKLFHKHNFAEANYQQPATCAKCGETKGEILTPEFEELGVVCDAQLDQAYDYTDYCYNDESQVTKEKVVFTNFKTFESDETHQAADGYEWKSVDINITVGDENANAYGFKTAWMIEDYYASSLMRSTIINNGGDSFSYTVNYNGIDYPECQFVMESKVLDWEERNLYDWVETSGIDYKAYFRVPAGYDGAVLLFYNEQNCSDAITETAKDIDFDDTLFFRFQ